MRLTIISILLSFNCFAQTYLPSCSQKFIVYEYGQSVAIVGTDIIAAHHLGMQLVTDCVDGGTTYTSIGTPATLATNLPVFYPCINSTFTAHSINFTQPGTYTAVDHGSTSNSSSGVSTNGSSSYWDTQFSTNDFGSGVSTLAGEFVYRTNSGSGSGVMIGMEGSGMSMNFNMNFSGSMYANILCSSATGITTSSASGYWAAQKTNTSTNNVTTYHNNAVHVLTHAETAASATNAIKIYIGCSNSTTGGSPNSYTALNFDAAGIIGALLSATQHTSLYNSIVYTNNLYGR